MQLQQGYCKAVALRGHAQLPHEPPHLHPNMHRCLQRSPQQSAVVHQSMPCTVRPNPTPLLTPGRSMLTAAVGGRRAASLPPSAAPGPRLLERPAWLPGWPSQNRTCSRGGAWGFVGRKAAGGMSGGTWRLHMKGGMGRHGRLLLMNSTQIKASVAATKQHAAEPAWCHDSQPMAA